MTNIIILICTILAGFLVGRHFANIQMQRGQFFGDLTKYIILLKANISSRRDELDTFNKDFSQSSSEVFRNYLLGGSNPSFLTKKQRALVDAFFASLSNTTSVQLLNNLDYYQKLIELENSTVEKDARNGVVSVKLGVLLGVMVGILLM